MTMNFYFWKMLKSILCTHVNLSLHSEQLEKLISISMHACQYGTLFCTLFAVFFLCPSLAVWIPLSLFVTLSIPFNLSLSLFPVPWTVHCLYASLSQHVPLFPSLFLSASKKHIHLAYWTGNVSKSFKYTLFTKYNEICQDT